MLKVVNAELFRLGQHFLDEVWGDDPDRISPPETPESHGRISPHRPQGVINEQNFEQFEPTSLEEPVEEQTSTEEFGEQPEYQREIPLQNELLGIPPETNEIEYPDGQQLVYDGIDGNEVISFDYTNRYGQYAGTRTVEPHYTFVAESTGNEVLVSFDRDQGDIRAFIVGNIHPYGVKYDEVRFKPRASIMRGIE